LLAKNPKILLPLRFDSAIWLIPTVAFKCKVRLSVKTIFQIKATSWHNPLHFESEGVYDGRVRKAFIFLLGILLFYVLGHFFTQIVYAEITVKQEPPDPLYYFDEHLENITLTFSSSEENTFLKDAKYSFFLWKEGQDINKLSKAEAYFSTNFNVQRIDDKTLEVNIPFQHAWNRLKESGWWIYKLYFGAGTEKIKKSDLLHTGSYYINPCSNANNKGCPSLALYQKTFQVSQEVPAVIINVQPDYEYKVWFKGEDKRTYKFKNSDITETATVSGQVFPAVTVKVQAPSKTSNKTTLCLSEGDKCDFNITGIQIEPQPVTLITPIGSPLITTNDAGVPDSPPSFTLPTSVPPLSPCSQWANLQGTPIPVQEAENIKDIKCIAVGTAIGDISTNPQGFVRSIFSIVLGLAGGIALILIILSGYRMMASSGNPEALTASHEQLFSAIIGLLFIIFSFVILQVIGVDILKIPGFQP